jgi:hypothetical protein
MKSSLAKILPSALGLVFVMGTGLAVPDQPWSTGPFACYAVAPLSSIPRLPDKISEDAKLSSLIRLVAAQGEFEPASFVIQPRQDVAKLELKPTALVGAGGEIPASAVDIKIVKTWYQGGTAWFSYFGDSNRRELVPELLLNDETLVKVDEEKKENYLRVGSDYQSVSYTADQAEKPFNYLTEPVADSRTLLPISLSKDRNKQIWVTVKVPADLPGGIYKGKIGFVADGKPAGAMDVEVKVLPFQLPLPKTYYNLANDYLVTMYATGMLGVAERYGLSREAAEKQQRAIFRDLLDHNIFNNRSETDIGAKDPAGDAEKMKRELQMMKETGFQMKPLLSRGWSYPLNDKETPEQFQARINLLAKTLKDFVGHDDIYVTSWDEAGPDRIKIMREATEYTNTQGLELWATTAKGKHFNLAGYIINYANHGGWPDREQSQQWHAIGSKVSSYAGPHTGPENPDIFRRWEGMARYKANYDGSHNYKYYSQINPAVFDKSKANVWNDFLGGAFRQFNLVYPTADGVIDTISWEGFREGIDDVRYATKLKQEADRAIASGNVKAVHAARKALMWLELFDAKNGDLTVARQEMIEYILKIQAAMAAN